MKITKIIYGIVHFGKSCKANINVGRDEERSISLPHILSLSIESRSVLFSAPARTDAFFCQLVKFYCFKRIIAKCIDVYMYI